MKRTLAALVLGTTLSTAACGIVDIGTGPRTDIVLDADSITLAGPSCIAEAGLSGITRDEFRGWSIEGENVAGLSGGTPRTGTTGWMYTGVMGRAPGTARLVATDTDGGRAAVRVRVLDGRTATTLSRDTIRVAVGDSVPVEARSSGPCGASNGNTLVDISWTLDVSRVRTDSQDPTVASLHPQVFRPTPSTTPIPRYFAWWVKGVKPGTTRIVGTFYGAADTAVVIVR